MDTLQRIMDYEDGTLSVEDTIALFQELVDTGLAWGLQGHYGRMATRLLEAGVITSPYYPPSEDGPDVDITTPWGEKV